MPDAETGTDRQQESVPTPLATAKNTPLQLSARDNSAAA